MSIFKNLNINIKIIKKVKEEVDVNKIIKKLEKIDINNITPMESLNILNDLRSCINE